jgi:superfamily I DNA/RNA helicase
VALPNLTLGSERLGLDAPREIIIDSSDLNGLESAVRRIMGTPDRDHRLTESAVDALIQCVRPSVEIARPGLAGQLLDGEREILRLTEAQYQVLDTLRMVPRAAVAGCAGSGKTALAIEKARRLAQEGFNVLFTCFNKRLAEWVERELSPTGDEYSGHVRVANFHRLAAEIHEEVTGEHVWNEQVDSVFFEETLPEYLDAAIPSLPYRFDAVIADEGQDFSPLWWFPIQELLSDPKRGVFYVFYDDQQQIFGRHLDLPVDLIPISLDTNLRNTGEIHEYVARYHQGDPPPRAGGPSGRQPEFVPVQNGDVREALRRTLDRLIREEGIPVSDIVVLTPRLQARSVLQEGEKIGNLRLAWDWDDTGRAVRVSTIHAFKGLESPVVVLAEIGQDVWWRVNDQLLYVALSRARGHLVVLGELPEPGG